MSEDPTSDAYAELRALRHFVEAYTPIEKLSEMQDQFARCRAAIAIVALNKSVKREQALDNLAHSSQEIDPDAYCWKPVPANSKFVGSVTLQAISDSEPQHLPQDINRPLPQTMTRDEAIDDVAREIERIDQAIGATQPDLTDEAAAASLARFLRSPGPKDPSTCYLAGWKGAMGSGLEPMQQCAVG